jgi:triosephosphate isomerase
VLKNIHFDKKHGDVIVAPPMIYVPILQQNISADTKLQVGAQNVSPFN